MRNEKVRTIRKGDCSHVEECKKSIQRVYWLDACEGCEVANKFDAPKGGRKK